MTMIDILAVVCLGCAAPSTYGAWPCNLDATEAVAVTLRDSLHSQEELTILIGYAHSIRHPGARVMLIRPPHGAAPILVVTGDTAPADLAHALRLLSASLSNHGHHAGKELRAFVQPVRWSSDQPVMEGSLLQAVRRAEKGPPDKYGAVGWIKARAALRAGRLEFIGEQSG